MVNSRVVEKRFTIPKESQLTQVGKITSKYPIKIMAYYFSIANSTAVNLEKVRCGIKCPSNKIIDFQVSAPNNEESKSDDLLNFGPHILDGQFISQTLAKGSTDQNFEIWAENLNQKDATLLAILQFTLDDSI